MKRVVQSVNAYSSCKYIHYLHESGISIISTDTLNQWSFELEAYDSIYNVRLSYLNLYHKLITWYILGGKIRSII